ncbi:diguanylate cyclase [Geobacter benzoatilyticus]|uniref:diguanylate cyclase n=1 Tax=Geobacter benzoatilyticus TaxID=2815309 RepID=A0ABX7Q5R4_9BACT|nr:diguanylate cyclase [Geobacter benzoatilyticus]QSV46779.1 diguanylate cyclase [Geobacter benzoatilyticus]
MTLTALVIDDSETLRAEILQILKEASLFDSYLEACDGLEGFKVLLNNRVDLVLCDLEMPRMDGFRFLAMMRAREEFQDVPVIILTGREDRDTKIRGLEQGASDYLTKPFDAGELVARVRVQLKVKSLQDELKRSNDMLRTLSITDPLTHLHNRRHLMEMVEKEFQRASRKGAHLSLIILDIDYFKKVNDTYGHQEGDRVLTILADIVRRRLRSYDLAARYGGEEFVLLLPETPVHEALPIAERLRLEVQEHIFDGSLQGQVITISLGVATYPSPRIESIDSLFRQADEALYRAKQSGRNRVELMAGVSPAKSEHSEV